MDPIAQAKEISNEAAQLAESLEQAGQVPTGTAKVTQYSSSTNSCEVDPETGVITLTTKLFPGDAPIQPEPVPGEAEAVPPVVPPAETAPGEGDQELPPGQVPAQ